MLVARHENEISGTTDVAAHAAFADRRTTRQIDGTPTTGWFTEDFTLAELKQLRAHERLPDLRPANAAYDGRFEIPTFAEIVALAQAHGVGVYPETKHPGYFRALGLPLEPPLLATLARAGWTRRTDPVFIQSFEVGNLRALREATALPLIQLIGDGCSADGADYAAMCTPAGLAAVARYGDGIGPAKERIVPRDAGGRSLAATTLVADAHAAGLLVHPWTFRSENRFLPAELRRGDDPAAHGDAAAEFAAFVALGIDGAFADFPAAAVSAARGG